MTEQDYNRATLIIEHNKKLRALLDKVLLQKKLLQEKSVSSISITIDSDDKERRVFKLDTVSEDVKIILIGLCSQLSQEMIDKITSKETELSKL